MERTARGYSVEASPKYIRELIAVLGLEHSRFQASREQRQGHYRENEKRTVYKTVVGKAVVHVP